MRSEDNFSLSRRAVLSTLPTIGLLGILTTQSEPTNAQSNFTPAVNFYRGPLSNRPEAGDANRIWIAEETGAVYYDDGNSWSLVDREYNSMSTKRVSSKTINGTIHNVREYGAEADGTTNDTPAIKDAANAASQEGGGTVFFPPGTYGVDDDGTTPDGVGVSLELPHDNVTYHLSDGATILNLSPLNHCVFLNGASHVSIIGGGTVNGNNHDSEQSGPHRAHAIAVGYKTPQGDPPDESTGCDNIRIDNITITGGHRHGIETGGGSQRIWIVNNEFTDASGDDPVSISGVTEYVYVGQNIAHNHIRDMGHTTASFEVDDGPRWVVIEGNISIGANEKGITIGKNHTGIHRVTKHNYVYNNVVIDATGEAYSIDIGNNSKSDINVGDNVTENIVLKGNDSYNSGGNGLRISSGEGTAKNIRVTDHNINGASGRGFLVTGDGDISDVLIEATIRNTAQDGVEFSPTDDANISDVTLEVDVSESGNAGIQIGGTTSAYSGRNYIKRSYVRNSNFGDLAFVNSDVQQFWLRPASSGNEWGTSAGNDGMGMAPANPQLGDDLIATTAWDPDGDGNGERVYYDGTAWQEIVNLPNL